MTKKHPVKIFVKKMCPGWKISSRTH